jgi:hypothetical protein
MRTEWGKTFLASFAKQGNVGRACKKAGVSRQAVTQRRHRDPEFERLYQEAKRSAKDRLEEEAYRRAVTGTRKPVFYLGEKVAEVREYSDGLLKMLLQANLPTKYRDRQLIEHRIAEPAVAAEQQRRLLADPTAAALAAELDARLAAPMALPGPLAREGSGETDNRPADQVSDR